MKWLPPDGGLQRTADQRYCIMRATTDPEQWVAYEFSAFGTTAEKIGEPLANIAEARQCCEDHETMLVSLKRRA